MNSKEEFNLERLRIRDKFEYAIQQNNLDVLSPEEAWFILGTVDYAIRCDAGFTAIKPAVRELANAFEAF